MKTVQDILDLLEANLNSEDAIVADWADTLCGPRSRGSTTTKSLLGVVGPDNNQLHKYEGPEVVNGCECYFFYAPELCGRLGAMQLKDVIGQHTVCMREGEHGLELYLDRTKPELPYENKIYVIIGKSEDGERMIFTWHPGKPLIPFDGEIKAQTAVKLHNG